jgi:hypothetical protein
MKRRVAQDSSGSSGDDYYPKAGSSVTAHSTVQLGQTPKLACTV